MTPMQLGAAMPETFATSAFQTVAQLASRTAVHRAFQWFHLQEPRLREWHRAVASIPAPPFGEAARADWLVEQFVALGLQEVGIDGCGNALGWLPGSAERAHPDRPCTLVSAHLDTVFRADAMGSPVQEGNRLLGPSVSDNCAGITALLGLAAGMQAARITPRSDILFAGNVGEEGDGDLRGMRYLFGESRAAARIRSAVILDGAGTETIVTQALGVKRFRVTIFGPGGHSWTDAGRPNPILILADALGALGRMELPSSPRTTLNIGHIEGGTAINAIPQRAEARLDTRSTDRALLVRLEEKIRAVVEGAVDAANETHRARSGDPAAAWPERTEPVRFEIATIGERPAAALADDAAILTLLRAVDRHLDIPSHPRTASTDANIPLSLGIEAVTIGGGGAGGGGHTPQEWFDAQGRDLALRRILLLVLALAQAEI